jgi:Flp pilus assembly protein TadG
MAYKNTVRRNVAVGAGRSAGCPRAFSRHARRFVWPRGRNAGLTVGEDGQTLIEMAITLPIMFALIFCFMELCLVFYTYDMISESAREGAQYAMLRSTDCVTNNAGVSVPCTATSTQVNTYVSHLGWPNIAGGTITPATTYVQVSPNAAGNIPGNYVNVAVTYVFPIKMPFVSKNSITLNSSSQMYIIQ